MILDNTFLILALFYFRKKDNKIVKDIPFKIQTSSSKINRSWRCNIQPGDYG